MVWKKQRRSNLTDTMDNFYCQLNIVRNNQGRGNTGSKPLSVSMRTFAERINLGDDLSWRNEAAGPGVNLQKSNEKAMWGSASFPFSASWSTDIWASILALLLLPLTVPTRPKSDWMLKGQANSLGSGELHCAKYSVTLRHGIPVISSSLLQVMEVGEVKKGIVLDFPHSLFT